MATKSIFDVKNSRLWHNVSISVNDRMISPIREDFIFTNFHSENKPLAKISEFTLTNLT